MFIMGSYKPLTIEKERRFVILLSLIELADQHDKNEFLNHIRSSGYYVFTEREQKRMLHRNEPSWRNDFAWVRKHLVQEGFMDGSEKNQWAITDIGRDYFYELFLEVSDNYTRITPTAIKRAEEIIRESLIGDGLIKENVEDIYSNSKELQEEYGSIADLKKDIEREEEGKEREGGKVRVNQPVFRRRVLENFDNKCCISGISQKDLLVASHIVPWSHDLKIGLRTSNGLCLSVLYDKLFDLGYISFDDNLKVIITEKVDQFDGELKNILQVINGKQANKPHSTAIDIKYLEYHRQKILHKK